VGTIENATALVEDDRIVWYQRFELAPGVVTPGVADTLDLMRRARFPESLTGLTVLDVGTCNGFVAFEAERRGASQVVAADIYPPDHFGFRALADFFDSQVKYVQATAYELPTLLRTQFDIVVLFGVLYHLRHPLLGLDAVRRLARRWVFIETAVADASLSPEVAAEKGIVRFFRAGELSDDSSNWFAPTTETLLDWCRSSGLEPELLDRWPDPRRPERCTIRATVINGEPEYERLSYEVALDVGADLTPVPYRRH
jgi:tRNA (mo5U34)-methyltransferase